MAAKSKRSPFKVIMKWVLALVLVVIFAICGYAGYFVLSWGRVGNQALIVNQGTSTSSVNMLIDYDLLNWNIGFGAYTDDYTFFMDGGKSGRAASEESVKKNIANMLDEIKAQEDVLTNDGFEFICMQEVDLSGTRSYNVNQVEFFSSAFKNYYSTFALTYDSPYIIIPLFDAHGANKSGLLTFSELKMTSAKRVELPIEDSLAKFVDCDRCYTLNRIPTVNGKSLVLINLHLSAYTSDGKIANEQLKIIAEECKAEIQKGNYVVCAGDFNKDLLGNSEEVFGVSGEDYTWAQPIDLGALEGSGMKLVAPTGENGTDVPTCRNPDKPYGEDNYVVSVDGFLVSENVTVKKSVVIDTRFKYSDHNPVMLTFSLKL